MLWGLVTAYYILSYPEIRCDWKTLKADKVLNRVIEYGLGAYRDYDEYCASSNISCQVINQQVTKLKRIRDEIKY